jgi:hypothetical protein
MLMAAASCSNPFYVSGLSVHLCAQLFLGAPNGSFLFRDSSEPEFKTISWIGSDGRLLHKRLSLQDFAHRYMAILNSLSLSPTSFGHFGFSSPCLNRLVPLLRQDLVQTFFFEWDPYVTYHDDSSVLRCHFVDEGNPSLLKRIGSLVRLTLPARDLYALRTADNFLSLLPLDLLRMLDEYSALLRLQEAKIIVSEPIPASDFTKVRAPPRSSLCTRQYS